MDFQNYWKLSENVFLENATIVSLIIIWLTSLLLTSLGTIAWVSRRPQLKNQHHSSFFARTDVSPGSPSSCPAACLFCT
ncbi:hypothetical protein BDV93DRAFT_169144 [Ceratobasidium sp. AG-I]|nr:hypothetical protein BDV93DRAFT_169144 [Ceratobasidium sp. AG-I]